MTKAMQFIYRARYVWIAITGALLTYHFVVAAGPHRWNDWIVFEGAARQFVHYHNKTAYLGDRWAIYARDSGVQIGPPAILPVAALQFLTPWTVSRIFVAVMAGLGFSSVIAAELTARTGGRPTPRDIAAPATLIGGLIVVVDWSWCAIIWHHLDDTIALGFAAIACWLIARGRPWWLIGVLLGTGAAAKPWAVILLPVLAGLPRETRSKAILVTLAVGAAWWAPFVIGAPDTIGSLGGYHIIVENGSILSLLGIRGDIAGMHGNVTHWLRPVQLLGGIAVGLLVARRGGRAWLAAPLAALCVRVLTDAYPWGYYGMGPILFALVWDLARPNATRIPIYTIITGAVHGLLPRFFHFYIFGPMQWQAYLVSSMKLVWGLGVLAAIAYELRRVPRDERQPVEPDPPPSDLVAATA